MKAFYFYLSMGLWGTAGLMHARLVFYIVNFTTASAAMPAQVQR